MIGASVASVHRAFVAALAALSPLVACSDPPSSVPRATEACNDPEPARCGRGQGQATLRNQVLVCDDGTWQAAVACPNNGTCRDDSERGAVLCTDENRVALPYGEQDGPCDVADAQACSTDLDFILECTDGTWSIATNCSTDIARCTLVDEDADPPCDEASGCLRCL